jgi:hypothetical protein
MISAFVVLYWPPPNRRDHQPARRGGASLALASGAGSAGAGGVAAACVSGAGVAVSDTALLLRKLTFSRTVERRGAGFSVGEASAAVGRTASVGE